MIQFKQPLTFMWDQGNSGKNKKHAVEDVECEEVFLDKNKVVAHDIKHSSKEEERYIILGKTRKARLLYLVFTMREDYIRVISARDINKKEVSLYEETT